MGAFILMGFAFYVGYPIQNRDTSAYMGLGFYLRAVENRPSNYGILLNVFSLRGTSLWIFIFFQCLVVSSTIYLFVDSFLSKLKPLVFIALILFLNFCSSIGWVASTLSPDVTTGLIVLIFCVLVMRKGLLNYQFILLGLLLIILVSCHSSNILLTTCMTFLVSLIYLLFKKKRFFSQKRVLAMWAILLGCWLIIPSTDYFVLGGKFSMDKGGGIFLTGKLIDHGLLTPFLEEHCEEKKYPICHGIDSIPDRSGRFLWGKNRKQPMFGAWGDSNKQFNLILVDFLKEPKYVKELAYHSLYDSWKMLLNCSLSAHTAGNGNVKKMQKFFPNELSQFKRAKLFLERNIKSISRRFSSYFFWALRVSLLTILLTVLIPRIRKNTSTNLWLIISIFLAAVLFNALICGTFSTNVSRYQARINWIIIIPAFMILIETWENRVAIFLPTSKSSS